MPAVKARRLRIAWNQLHVHRAGRARDLNRANDGPRVEVPHADRATQHGIAGDDIQRAGRQDEIGRHHQVESRARAEMPCGLKPSSGGLSGHSLTRFRPASNSASRPGAPPVAEPICVTRKPPPSSGRKSSVMLDCGRARGEQELRSARAGDVEEEDAVLSAQHAEQAAAGKNVLVGRQMTVVGLVANAPRKRNRNGPDDLAIVVRVIVEVDDRQEVRGHTGLIAGPDIESFRRFCRRRCSPVIAVGAGAAGQPMTAKSTTHTTGAADSL